MAYRGIQLSYETIRRWCDTFGASYAAKLKRRRPKLGDTWFLDEVFLKINGVQHYFVASCDQQGTVIDILVQPKRDRFAAMCSLVLRASRMFKSKPTYRTFVLMPPRPRSEVGSRVAKICDSCLVRPRVARNNGLLRFGATVLLAVLLFGFIRKQASFDNDGVLHVRGLAVMDAGGTTRARLQAPLPEPVIMGTQQKRDDSVSGVMLYDKLGNERGGYVTDNSIGNAFFTLDSNTGQEVTLVAYPNGGAEFAINDDQKNKVSLGALKNGPRLRLVKSGNTVFEQPDVGQTQKQ